MQPWGGTVVQSLALVPHSKSVLGLNLLTSWGHFCVSCYTQFNFSFIFKFTFTRGDGLIFFFSFI